MEISKAYISRPFYSQRAALAAHRVQISHSEIQHGSQGHNPPPLFLLLFAVSAWACAFSMCSVMSISATLWTVACQTPLYMGFSRQ